MLKNSLRLRARLVVAIIATIFSVSVFGQTNTDRDSIKKEPSVKYNENDNSSSLKRSEDINFRKLDLQLKKLDVQMQHLQEQMKDLDFKKVQLQLDEALKKLDMTKVSEQVKESLQKIDLSAINKQINESFAKLDKVKMKEVAREMEKAKAELVKQGKDVQVKIPKIDMEKIMAESKVAMTDARRSMEKAKEELTNMKEFTRALQNDKIIDNALDHKIEVRGGELYIDGKKRSKEVSDKYRKYYRSENFKYQHK